MAGKKTYKISTRASNNRRKTKNNRESLAPRDIARDEEEQGEKYGQRRHMYGKKRTNDRLEFQGTSLSDSDSDTESREEESISSANEFKRAKTTKSPNKPFDLVTWNPA